MNIERLIASRRTANWTVAEDFLYRREASLLRRLNAATMPYQRKRLSVALDRIYGWMERISENWGNLYSASAADCAGYSDYLVGKGDWEARTGERWHD